MTRQILWLFAFTVASFTSLAAQPAFADPASDLAAVKTAFQNVNSVHVDIKEPQESVTLDLINPDKVHWSISNGMQLIAIGAHSWEGMDGRWMARPGQPAMAVTLMEHLRTLNLESSDIRKKYNVTDKGMTTAAAHKYHVVNRQNGDTFDLLIGANGLPVQYLGKDETWTFSQYNSVADIKPPM